jgi:two-component sensor histidine kinase
MPYTYKVRDFVLHYQGTPYILAVGCVAASFAIRETLRYYTGSAFPTVTFYPSIVISALFGGLFPGLLATALSTIMVWYVILPPRLSFNFASDAIGLILFMVGNIGIVLLVSHYRQLLILSGAETRHLEFTLRESTHRVKNLLAVMQGISKQIARRTKDVGEFQDAFYERLHCLAQSHDLLVNEKWQSVDLTELIITQLKAFNAIDRIKIDGESIFLNPTATEQLGLAIYELGSNTMKYGAWKYGGSVHISWKVINNCMEFIWKEIGVFHKTDIERTGFGYFVLTEVVPRNLLGQSTLTSNPGGITWWLSISSQYYSATSRTSYER